LDRALLGLTHPRTPEVYYVMAADDTPDRWGHPGSCYFSGEAIPVGGATHGGLHPIEMNNLLAMGGAAFRQGYSSPWPASHTDIVPTMLEAFGIQAPDSMTGRRLTEAYAEGAFEPAAPQTVNCTSESRARRQHLKLSRVGNTTYIDSGRSDSV
jgi:arylsulfatase A-like enzyme